MPVQSIDLSTVTDATFNGSAVEQINLNGAGVWTKPAVYPTGVARIVGHSGKLQDTFPNPTSAYSIPMTQGMMVHSGTKNRQALIVDNINTTPISISQAIGNLSTITVSVNHSVSSERITVSILGPNNTIEVYYPLANGNTNPQGAVTPYTSSGATVLNSSQVYAMTQASVANYGSNLDYIWWGVMYPRSTAFDSWHRNSHNITTALPSNLQDGALLVKLGHYDASQTFIVDPIYDTEQQVYHNNFTLDTYGNTIDSYPHDTILWKPDPNENKLYIKKTKRLMNGTTLEPYTHLIEVTGAVNGYIAPWSTDGWHNAPPNGLPVGWHTFSNSCTNGQFYTNWSALGGSTTPLKLP